MTDGTVEDAVVGAGEHGHFESNLRDPEHRERRGRRLARRFKPGTDANRRPQRLVRRRGMRRLDLERGEAIQIVARPSGVPDMERGPNRQADKADRPAHSLGERQKPGTYDCHGGQLQKP
jgi:hypothetical protein